MRPIGDAEHANQHGGVGARERDDQKRDQREGQRQLDVDDAHDEHVHPSPEQARDQAERNADGEPDQRADQGQRQRQPQPVKAAREQVASELIGAEPMRGMGALEALRRPQAGQKLLLVGVERRERRRHDRQHDERERQQRGGGNQRADAARPAQHPSRGLGQTALAFDDVGHGDPSSRPVARADRPAHRPCRSAG